MYRPTLLNNPDNDFSNPGTDYSAPGFGHKRVACMTLDSHPFKALIIARRLGDMHILRVSPAMYYRRSTSSQDSRWFPLTNSGNRKDFRARKSVGASGYKTELLGKSPWDAFLDCLPRPLSVAFCLTVSIPAYWPSPNSIAMFETLTAGQASLPISYGNFANPAKSR